MLSPEGASGVLRMVEVVDELKAKLIEIDDKMEELARSEDGSKRSALYSYRSEHGGAHTRMG
jgi:hypothetical protein